MLAAGQEERQRARDQEVVEVALQLLDEPVPLLVVQHLPRHPGRARGPRASRARSAGRRRCRGSSSSASPRSGGRRRSANSCSSGAGVVGLAHARVDLVLLLVLRREVPEVLVDPVAHRRRRRSARPTRAAGGTPRATTCEMFQSSWTSWSSQIIGVRTFEKQPPDPRVAPRLPVQARVLLEVLHLLAGRLGGVAARADELERLRRHLVGVDLVAQQDEHVRPLVRLLRDHPARERVEGVHLAAALVVLLRVRCTAARAGASTRHEPKQSFSRPWWPVVRITRRRELGVGLGPAALAVEVRPRRVRLVLLEARDVHDRVVVARDVEGALLCSRGSRPRTAASVSTQTVASVAST